MNTTTMIGTGKGTPIFLVPRNHGGLLLTQGKSHILLSPDEIGALMSYVQGATE